MIFNHTHRALWIFCAMFAIYASPIYDSTSLTNDSSSSNLQERKEESFSSDIKSRERRQLNPFSWNNVQNLSKSITNTVDRVRDIVQTGIAPDSPLVRMANEITTRVVPAFVSTFYTSIVQNVRDQIWNQARTIVNDWLDRLSASS